MRNGSCSAFLAHPSCRSAPTHHFLSSLIAYGAHDLYTYIHHFFFSGTLAIATRCYPFYLIDQDWREQRWTIHLALLSRFPSNLCLHPILPADPPNATCRASRATARDRPYYTRVLGSRYSRGDPLRSPWDTWKYTLVLACSPGAATVGNGHTDES